MVKFVMICYFIIASVLSLKSDDFTVSFCQFVFDNHPRVLYEYNYLQSNDSGLLLDCKKILKKGSSARSVKLKTNQLMKPVLVLLFLIKIHAPVSVLLALMLGGMFLPVFFPLPFDWWKAYKQLKIQFYKKNFF